MTAPARPATPLAGQERPQPSKPATLRAKLRLSGSPARPPTPWHNSGRHPTSAGEGSAAEPITSPEHRNGPEAKAERVRELRAVLADCHDRPTRAHDNTIPPRRYHCGRRSRGRAWLAVEVQAFCECGWATPWQQWATPPEAAAKTHTRTNAAREEHQAFTTHRRFAHDRWPEHDGYHQRCGWFHDFQDVCPAPPNSTAGRVNRVSGGSPSGTGPRHWTSSPPSVSCGTGSTNKRRTASSEPASRDAPGPTSPSSWPPPPATPTTDGHRSSIGTKPRDS
jgi:hypothetical protein